MKVKNSQIQGRVRAFLRRTIRECPTLYLNQLQERPLLFSGYRWSLTAIPNCLIIMGSTRKRTKAIHARRQKEQEACRASSRGRCFGRTSFKSPEKTSNRSMGWAIKGKRTGGWSEVGRGVSRGEGTIWRSADDLSPLPLSSSVVLSLAIGKVRYNVTASFGLPRICLLGHPQGRGQDDGQRGE